MAWTVDASGTQTATIGTEHTLATSTTNATFQPKFDLSNMANGDALELRIYTKVLSTSGLNQVWKGTYSNVQINTDAIGPMLASDQSYKITLKQITGTGRNYDWSLLRQ